jgi:two-component system chemotaxis response regulator CheB
MAQDGAPHSLFVVGASAGGVEALTRIVAGLPPEFPAAIAIVLHLPANGTSVLPAILNRAGHLPAVAAKDGEPIQRGHIYVAPPDHHLLVGLEELSLTHGPRENGHRPAIDPLFISAAHAYGPGVVGIILTGTLDDGAVGLAAIKAHEGVAVVQNPDDALYRGMPDAALERVAVDHVVDLADVAGTMVTLARDGRPAGLAMNGAGPTAEPPRPGDELAAGPQQHEGEAAGISCPECGGALWEVGEGNTTRFRCRIGHAYSEDSLLAAHGNALETALWTALRALEERAALLRRLSRRSEAAGRARSALRFAEHAAELERRAETVRLEVLPGEAMASVESTGA